MKNWKDSKRIPAVKTKINNYLQAQIIPPIIVMVIAQ